MFYLKKIKSLYLDIIFVALASLSSTLAFLSVIDFFVGNLMLVYVVVSLLMSFGLYYLHCMKWDKVRNMIRVVLLCLIGYIFYCLYSYIDFNISSLLSFINTVIEQQPIVAHLIVFLLIYWMDTIYVNIIYRKKYNLLGLFPVVLIVAVEYSIGLTRNPLLILILSLIVFSSYFVSAPMHSKYKYINPLHVIVIAAIAFVMIGCFVFIPYDSYVERPLADYIMDQYALSIQKDYEERNDYVDENSDSETTSDVENNNDNSNKNGTDDQETSNGESGKGSGGGGLGGSGEKGNSDLEVAQARTGVSVSGDKGAESDLSTAGNMSLDNKKVVLYVTSSKGPISTLLRGSSSAHYNNGKWSYLNAIEASAISDLPQSLSYTRNCVSGINNSKTGITITEISKISATKYFPYYSSSEDRMSLDCYVRGATTYSYSDVLYDINSISLLSKKGNYTNKTYDNFVKNNYLSMDENLKKTLKSYLNENNVNESMLLTAKVKAVQNLLANTCTYTLKPGTCPSGKEPTEYFLFENKKGYCMHFASTGTLLLRSLGVPTRYCTGYMLLEKKFDGNTACVPSADSHAWCEVYREGVGWIPVDFTPASGNSGDSASMMPVPIGSAEDTKLQNVEEIRSKMQGEQKKEEQKSEEIKTPKEEEKEEEKKEESSQGDKKEEVKTEEKKEEEKKEEKKEKEETSSERNSDSPFLIFIVIAVSIICSVGLIYLRHRYVINKREKEFNQEDLNKCYIACWRHLNQLKAFGQPFDFDFDSNALKAAFSKEQITKEDIIEINDFIDSYSYNIYESLSIVKKGLFKYIYNLIA